MRRLARYDASSQPPFSSLSFASIGPLVSAHVDQMPC